MKYPLIKPISPTDKMLQALYVLENLSAKRNKEFLFISKRTGGEPLVRKKDLIRICEKHDDCMFLCFTNATLIDEAFADEMLRVKNFIPAISLEGDEASTDSRRGKGTYQKVRRAMELLHQKKLPYGISSCYPPFQKKSGPHTMRTAYPD